MGKCAICGLSREKCRDITITESKVKNYRRVTIKGKYSIIHSKDELIGLREKLNDLEL